MKKKLHTSVNPGFFMQGFFSGINSPDVTPQFSVFLTVIDKALKLIRETTGNDIDLTKIPMDDKKTYELLSRGDVKGVFQVETSRGFKELLKKLKPDKFADILPLVALYRPGPLQSGTVDSFINRKHGREEVTYLHPLLEPLLKETYGVILY